MRIKLYTKEYNQSDEPVIFLETLSKKIICELMGYYDDFKENPLIYRERTLSSVIFPALMKSTRRAAMEIYYNNGNRNFLDYYAMDEFRENVYLIETKHLFLEDKEKFGKFFLNRWEDLNKQFEKIEIEVVNEYIDSKKNIHAISLAVIVPWFFSEKENSLEKYTNIVKEELKNLDWLYIYDLQDSEIYKNEFPDVDVYYPWIMLAGRIKTVEEAN
ncbi:hypothetical protein LIY46_14010 [Fusobacterium varium]|uniref:hypothetical protein n=1 Tax=Fusobacterium TaxID=848 RepID=UPI0015A0A512